MGFPSEWEKRRCNAVNIGAHDRDQERLLIRHTWAALPSTIKLQACFKTGTICLAASTSVRKHLRIHPCTGCRAVWIVLLCPSRELEEALVPCMLHRARKSLHTSRAPCWVTCFFSASRQRALQARAVVVRVVEASMIAPYNSRWNCPLNPDHTSTVPSRSLLDYVSGHQKSSLSCSPHDGKHTEIIPGKHGSSGHIENLHGILSVGRLLVRDEEHRSSRELKRASNQHELSLGEQWSPAGADPVLDLISLIIGGSPLVHTRRRHQLHGIWIGCPWRKRGPKLLEAGGYGGFILRTRTPKQA
jgi:hypothetical protein